MSKRIALIKEINCCFDCPYHSGGRSLGSPLYCVYFKPARQIFDSNGRNAKYEDTRDIAVFCPLPENETVNFI